VQVTNVGCNLCTKRKKEKYINHLSHINEHVQIIRCDSQCFSWQVYTAEAKCTEHMSLPKYAPSPKSRVYDVFTFKKYTSTICVDHHLSGKNCIYIYSDNMNIVLYVISIHSIDLRFCTLWPYKKKVHCIFCFKFSLEILTRYLVMHEKRMNDARVKSLRTWRTKTLRIWQWKCIRRSRNDSNCDPVNKWRNQKMTGGWALPYQFLKDFIKKSLPFLDIKVSSI
jgi:hypothetical protein